MSTMNPAQAAQAWSFESEAGLILQVFTAQLRAGAADGDAESVALDTTVSDLMRAPANDGSAAAAVTDSLAALQTVQRLSQRLHHVADGLDLLAALLQGEHVGDPAAWAHLKGAIRDSYTFSAECELFDALLATRSMRSHHEPGVLR